MTMNVTMHPIWQSGAIVLIASVAAALLLQSLVHRAVPASLRRDHTALGGAIFAVIGTTYAVLLAFMATTAWDQYSAAEQLARREAGLAAGLYRATQGIPDPAGAAMRADVTAYLEQVITAEWPAQIAGRQVPPEEAHLARLAQAAAAPAGAAQAGADLRPYLVMATSDIATARRDRRLLASGGIPGLVWVVLLSGGMLVVGFSFLLGAPAPGVHLVMTGILVASGVLVLLLIVGLSSPFHGTVTIQPDAYAAVLAELRGSP